MSDLVWNPTKKQSIALRTSADMILYGGSRGGGKRIAFNTPVLTKKGWKQASDITYKDKLVAPDGKYCDILGIYKQDKGSMYKVTFVDDRFVYADAEHLWTVYSKDHGHRDGWIVRNTKQLLNNPKNWNIPLVGKIGGKQWKGVDPYILGYILGDGTLTGQYTTIYTVDLEIVEYLRKDGWFIYDYPYQNTIMCQNTNNKYRDILGKVKGEKKYVPKDLLFADYNTRLAVLQGLMDSDGSCDKEGRATFTNKSYMLCKAVQYLTRSLGGKSNIVEVNRSPKLIKGYMSSGYYYKVTVSYVGKFKPFRLSRKAKRLHMNQKADKLGIKSIIKTKDVPAVCFKIDHPSSLFVIKDFIVTHNTDAAIRWLLYNKDIKEARSLVIRRNAKDLSDFVDRAKAVYSAYGAKVVGNPAIFVFPSGFTIRTGHLAFDNAYEAYQGHEYQQILIEELTHIPTQELFEKLMGSLRSTIKGVHAQFLGTTNPGNAGHEWVKAYWHIEEEAYPPMQKFREDGVYKIFIPATVEDNPYLAKRDPKYVRFLQNLPVDLREKWYKGSWKDIDTENQYYASIISRAEKQGRITTVPIEPSLRTFASLDLGIKDKMSVWIAQIHGKEIRIVDFYEDRNRPLKHYADYLRTFEHNNDLHIEEIVVPHDAQVRSMVSDSLQTRAEKLEELGFSVRFAPNVSVEDGVEAVRTMLGACYIDKIRCKKGIYALRKYQKEFDEKMNRYKDKPLHDWASDPADSFRYLSLYIPTVMTAGTSKIGDMQKKAVRRRKYVTNRKVG